MRETWWWSLEGAGRLEELGLIRIDLCVEAAGHGTLLSSDRQSCTVLLPGPPAILLKWRHTLPRRRWRTFLRASRERREAHAHLRAIEVLRTRGPRPFAVAERRTGGRLVASVLLREHLPGATLAERLASVPAAARALREWHDLGFRHGDCWPKNLLLDGADPVGVVPIGDPSARWVRPGARWDRRRRKDLAQLAAGCHLASSEPFGFLDAYLAAPGLGDRAAAERRIRPLFERVLEKKRRRKESEPRREPHGPPRPVPPPPWSGAPSVRPL